MPSTKDFQIRKYRQENFEDTTDILAVEEPLEINIQYFQNGEKRQTPVSITMRTPGNDRELALGFLYTEGILKDSNMIDKITDMVENQITIHLREGAEMDLQKLKRNFYTTSSCGVCGKSSIDAIRTITSQDSSTFTISETPINHQVLLSLKEKINAYQSNFSQTGGIHASALFDIDGNLLKLYEDVGRHNALDKLIGHHVINGNLNFENKILLLSGRASFELIQKAIMANISIVCAIGAPSSLAVELAAEFGITLIGFLKNESFNIYHQPKELNITP